MSTETYPYALVVRWPVGGIRTHLKYSKEMLSSEEPVFSPLYISFDDEDTKLALSSLRIPSDANYSQGIHSLVAMFIRVLKVARRSDIKVIHSQGFISAILSTPAALLFRKRHVVSVHDVITDEVIAERSYLSRLVLGACLRCAYAVHAVGRDCAASIRRLPLMSAARNIVTIRNGIDPARFTQPAPADLRALCGAAHKSKLIGFFGRFHPQKGFRYLVDAVDLLRQSHPEVHLKVVAVGDAGTIKEDARYIEEKGLKDYFFFHPQVENPAALMAACDMIAMPSLWEAYSLLAAEVLTLGIPLIASDCIGLAEVVENSPAKLFPSRDTGALAEALLQEAQNPSTADAQAFTSEARLRFDFTESARQINSLLYTAQLNKPLHELR